MISPSLSPSRSLPVSSMNLTLPLALVVLEVYKAVLSIGSGFSNSFLASRTAACSSSAAFYSSYLCFELFLTTLGVFFSTTLVVIESMLIKLSHGLSPLALLFVFSFDTAATPIIADWIVWEEASVSSDDSNWSISVISRPSSGRSAAIYASDFCFFVNFYFSEFCLRLSNSFFSSPMAYGESS